MVIIATMINWFIFPNCNIMYSIIAISLGMIFGMSGVHFIFGESSGDRTVEVPLEEVPLEEAEVVEVFNFYNF